MCFCEPCKPKMQRLLEQRSAIKFCGKLGKTAVETFEMIKRAYPEDYFVRICVFRLHKAILEDREELANKQGRTEGV